MSSSRSLVISAVSAAIIAIVLVSGVVAIGVLNTTHSTTAAVNPIPSSSTSQSNGSSQTGSAPGGVSTISSSSASPPPQTQTAGSSGNVAVLMTDPPTVPDGVTAVYITFENMRIHVSSAGNYTGWHVLNLQGEIDLMSVINSTQTVAAANITSGDFNALAFNVTSALVTFQGQNYTADLVYQEHTLFVPIQGGINVTNGQSAAAVIDVSPTVLLLGNLTDPTFAFIPAATGYTIPAQSVSTLQLKVGERDNITNASWWVTIVKQSKFQITGVSLTPTSLSFNVTNVGNYPVDLKIADVFSRTSVSGGNIPLSDFSQLLMQSEVFVLQRNGTMAAVTVVGNGAVEHLIDSAGYILPVGRSVTFTYSGNVTIGVAITSISKHASTQAVEPGGLYVLSVSGSGMVAQTAVSAS